VDVCTWAHASSSFHDAPDQSIFCVDMSAGSAAAQLIESEDFFTNTTNTVVLSAYNLQFKGIEGLQVVQKFIVAAVSMKENDGKDTTELFVSENGHTWAHARIQPTDLGLHGRLYTILDSSTDALVVDIASDDDNRHGTMYMSDSNGAWLVKSLDHTNRNTLGIVDYEMVGGVRGFALANTISNWNTTHDEATGWLTEELTEKRLVTRITTDDGARWQYLKPPPTSGDGRPFSCSDDYKVAC
jgi:hypothetical protein